MDLGLTEEDRATTTSLRVRAAYHARLGEPDAETEFEQNGLRVSVLRYAPSRPPARSRRT
ncbi:hypothetical protein [Actinoplanes sp. NPDC051494]|uniref:hypothetical protein n=1 Tax=Actinoplanes sp. NPDC051494 TaxID=3363907 RepID=UPI003796E4A7